MPALKRVPIIGRKRALLKNSGVLQTLDMGSQGFILTVDDSVTGDVRAKEGT